jgi:hypothetical protein
MNNIVVTSCCMKHAEAGTASRPVEQEGASMGMVQLISPRVPVFVWVPELLERTRVAWSNVL